jgi:hypothetical protein
MGYLRNRNGVSVYGPSQDLINSGGSLNVSVTTVEKVLTSLTIPANTFVTGDCINIVSRIVKSSGNGVTAIRMRIGTSGTVSDELIGGFTGSSATHTLIPIVRTICYYSGTTNYVLGVNDNFCKLVFSSSVSPVTIDWSTINIVTISGINISNTDNMNGMFIKTKVL